MVDAQIPEQLTNAPVRPSCTTFRAAVSNQKGDIASWRGKTQRTAVEINQGTYCTEHSTGKGRAARMERFIKEVLNL